MWVVVKISTRLLYLQKSIENISIIKIWTVYIVFSSWIYKNSKMNQVGGFPWVLLRTVMKYMIWYYNLGLSWCLVRCSVLMEFLSVRGVWKLRFSFLRWKWCCATFVDNVRVKIICQQSHSRMTQHFSFYVPST